MNYIINEDLKMGKMFEIWGEGKNIIHVTLCITQDCNFACTYCYCLDKNNNNTFNYATAIKIIDYLLSSETFSDKDGILLDFIGGEPTLEIDLIVKICDYLVKKMYLENHKWMNMYRFMITTNGYLYASEKVQNFIKRHRAHIQIAISLDGNKIKHDMTRKLKDGTGTYDVVIKNAKLLLEQFDGAQTKATFSSEDIPYLKDSIIHLWEVGFDIANANIVFEDVWKDEDVEIFEVQLRQLADYILENKLWNDYSTIFFDPYLGLPLSYNSLENLPCGAGNSIAIDSKGIIYPCHRFIDFTQKENTGYSIGDIYNGINIERLRPLQAANRKFRNPEKCKDCMVATGCGGCIGFDYSVTSNFYERTTYNCEMHKANVRVNNYFWDKYSELTGYISPHRLYQMLNPGPNTKYLYIMFNTNISFCHYIIQSDINNQQMSNSLFLKGLKYAFDNEFIPVVIGDRIDTIYQYNIYDKAINHPFQMVTITINDIIKKDEYISDTIILKFSRNDISMFSNAVIKLCSLSKNINLVVNDMELWNDDDLLAYEQELEKIVNFFIQSKIGIEESNINILHNLMNITSMINCNAGVTSYALAPNGKFYICPAFFYEMEELSCGDIDIGINKDFNTKILDYKSSPLCSDCNNFTCKRCVFLNKKITGEYNIPSSMQCKITNIEHNASYKLQRYYIKNGIRFNNLISENIDYDLIENIRQKKKLDVYGLIR